MEVVKNEILMGYLIFVVNKGEEIWLKQSEISIAPDKALFPAAKFWYFSYLSMKSML